MRVGMGWLCVLVVIGGCYDDHGRDTDTAADAPDADVLPIVEWDVPTLDAGDASTEDVATDAGNATDSSDSSGVVDADADAFDPCTVGGAPDRDGDGVIDACDVCPDVADPRQFDLDGDGIGWACDAFEELPRELRGADLSGAAGYGAIVLTTRTNVLTADAEQNVFIGRSDGTDDALGRVDQQLAGAVMTPTRFVLGAAIARIDHGSVTVLGDAASRHWVVARDGTITWHPASAPHGTALGISAPDALPVTVDAPPGAGLCWTSPVLVQTTTETYAAVSDGLRRVEIDGVPMSGTSSSRWCSECTVGPGGEPWLVRIDEHGAAHVVVRTGVFGTDCYALRHWGLAGGRRLIETTGTSGSSSSAVTILDADGSLLAHSVGMSEPYRWIEGDDVWVAWPSHLEHFDLADGTSTTIPIAASSIAGTTGPGRRLALAWNDGPRGWRLVALEGPRVVLDVTTSQPQTLRATSGLTLARGPDAWQAWLDGAATPAAIGLHSDRPDINQRAIALEGWPVLLQGARDDGTPTAVLVRARDGRVDVLDVPFLADARVIGHEPSPRWLAVATGVVRVADDGAGGVVVGSSASGSIVGDATMTTPHGTIVQLADGGATSVVLLAESRTHLATGRPATEGAALEVTQDDEGSVHGWITVDGEPLACRLLGGASTGCWSLAEWTGERRELSPPLWHDWEPQRRAWVVSAPDGRRALFRPIGPPERPLPL